jgi:hypothetical protein
MLEGGAASGPVDGSNPPTAHTIGFNTVDSGPIAGGWEMNPGGASGRSFLAYAVHTNNPGLDVDTLLRVEYDVEVVGAGGDGVLVLSYSALTGITVLASDRFVAPGERRIVWAIFRIDDPSYTIQIRVGTGVTTTRTEHTIVYGPCKLFQIQKLPSQFAGGALRLGLNLRI